MSNPISEDCSSGLHEYCTPCECVCHKGFNARQLAAHFSKTFGFKEWPKTYEVDAETYALVCQAIFDHELEIQFPDTKLDVFALQIAVGPNNGLMFKNVELILRREK